MENQAFADYLDWVRKNWFTVLGIIIILSLVWWDAATNLSYTKQRVDECIEHYESQIRALCPNPSIQQWPEVNITFEFNDSEPGVER